MKNFPNLAKEIDIQVQEVKRVPNKMNPHQGPHQDIIKWQRSKTKIES